MRALPVVLAACAAHRPPPVPLDGPAAIAARYDTGDTRVIELAVWPDGEVVFDADGVARHARIDPAIARNAIVHAAALVTSLERTFTTNGEFVSEPTADGGEEEAPDDDHFLFVAVRTREGYYVVEGRAWGEVDLARAPRPFAEALALLRALRPATGERVQHAFPGEAGVRDLLYHPGMHRFRP